PLVGARAELRLIGLHPAQRLVERRRRRAVVLVRRRERRVGDAGLVLDGRDPDRQTAIVGPGRIEPLRRDLVDALAQLIAFVLILDRTVLALDLLHPAAIIVVVSV